MIEKYYHGIEHELAVTVDNYRKIEYFELYDILNNMNSDSWGVNESSNPDLAKKLIEFEEEDAHGTRHTRKYEYDSKFMLNGFKAYNDLNHFEICEPTINNCMQSVIYNTLTELIAYKTVRATSYRTGKVFEVYKNNVSNNIENSNIESNSYGTHYNVCLKRENMKDWNNVLKSLSGFFITRQLLFGCGEMVDKRMIDGLNGAKFVISPRMIFLKRLISGDTMDRRGLFNTRDQPLAGREYFRFHDINYESLRCLTNIYLREGISSLVMGAFENNYLKDAPKILNPVKNAKKISIDTNNMDWLVETVDGKISALRILDYYMNKVEDMLDDLGSTSEDRTVLGLWNHVMNKLEERKISDLEYVLDWATKKILLKEYIDEGIVKTGWDGVCLLNQYSLLDEATLFYEGKKATDCESVFDPEISFEVAKNFIRGEDWNSFFDKIIKGLAEPPENSRDYFRSKIMNNYGKNIVFVNWHKIVLDNKVIMLSHPNSLNKKICDSLGITFSESVNDLYEKICTGGDIVCSKRLFQEKITKKEWDYII